MTDPATLNALAAEVEAGNGPDREIDARIEDAIGPSSEYPGSHLLSGFTGGRANWLRQTAPAYTASVDAALALLREKLPGWAAIRMTTLHSPTGRASSDVEIRPMFDEQIVFHCGEAPTLPRAIVAAVLRAAARGDG